MFVVNKFNGRRKVWETQEFYPKKYGNFHKCSLSAVKKSNTLGDREFFAVIGSILNFQSAVLEANYSQTANFSAMEVDLIGGVSYLNAGGFSLTEIVTTPFFVTHVLGFFPSGEPYTQFEKMWMMFELEVWIAIVAFLLLWFASIQIINLTSKNVQKFVHGDTVRTPTINMLNLFLNGGQSRVPGRNFARFILILLIIWCLIIRTCYQSKLFTFLQSDLRTPTKYDFDAVFYNKTKLRRVMGCSDAPTCLDIVAEYSNKMFLPHIDTSLDLIHKGEYRSGISSIQIDNQPYTTFFWAHTFPEFSPYIEDFNDVLGRIISSGLGGSWKLFEVERIFKRKESDDIGPQVLTMDHLAVGFFACCCPLVLASLAFIAEVFRHAITVRLIYMK